LEPLAGLEQLEVLFFPLERGDPKAPRLRAGSLAVLARLPALRKLSIDGREITEELTGLEHLDQLEVQDAALGVAAMEQIAQIKPLRSLGLHDCQASAVAMAQLCNLPHLAVLRLYHTSIEPGGIAALAGAPALREMELWLERRSVLRHALVQVGKLKQLRSLLVWGPPTSEDLALLTGLADLESLSIVAPVDNLGAYYLARLPALKKLQVDQSKITDSGLNELARLAGLEELTISGFFTDRGLASLVQLQALRALDAGSPYVTQPAGEDLAAGLPAIESIKVHSDDPLENRPKPAEKKKRPAPAAADSAASGLDRGNKPTSDL
jgi:hypothetical protein